MDTAQAAFMATPEAEVLEEVLQPQLGTQPQEETIRSLKRLPSGASSMDDPNLVLEQSHTSNTKARERVAGVVLTDSPQLSEEKDINVEEVNCHLISNPFVPTKEIPRTPANLKEEIQTRALEKKNLSDDRMKQ